MPDQGVALAPHVLLRPERDGGLVYDTLRNKLFSLDSEGFAVADACVLGVTQEQIADLVQRCSGSPEASDNLVAQLVAEKLLVNVPERQASAEPSPEAVARFLGHWRNDNRQHLPTVPGPLLVYLELTHRCNLSCVYCYNDSGPSRGVGLTGECARSLLEEFRRLGVFYVSFTGGEPLVRNDTLDLIDLAGQFGIRQILATNGTVITDRICERLARSGISQVQVSLDAADGATHDRLRGLPGAFGRTIAGIKLLVQYGLPVTICCVASEESLPRLNDLVRLAVDLGAKNFRVLGMMAVGRGSDLPAVTPATRTTLNAAVESLALKFAGQIRVVTSDIHAGADCGSGVAFCAISANGDLTPCSFASSMVVGNVGSATFQELWEKSPMLARFREIKRRRSFDPTAVSCVAGGCQASLMSIRDGGIH